MCSFGATEHQSSPIFAFLPIFSYTKCPKVPICARPIYSPGVALQNASGYSIFSGRAKGVSFPCGVFLQRLMRELQNPKVVQIFYTMLYYTSFPIWTIEGSKASFHAAMCLWGSQRPSVKSNSSGTEILGL